MKNVKVGDLITYRSLCGLVEKMRVEKIEQSFDNRPVLVGQGREIFQHRVIAVVDEHPECDESKEGYPTRGFDGQYDTP